MHKDLEKIKKSVLVITPSSLLSSNTGRILTLLLIIKSCISFKVVSGFTWKNSTFIYSFTGLSSRPKKTALSTIGRDIYPLSFVFSSVSPEFQHSNFKHLLCSKLIWDLQQTRSICQKPLMWYI